MYHFQESFLLSPKTLQNYSFENETWACFEQLEEWNGIVPFYVLNTPSELHPVTKQNKQISDSTNDLLKMINYANLELTNF